MLRLFSLEKMIMWDVVEVSKVTGKVNELQLFSVSHNTAAGGIK